MSYLAYFTYYFQPGTSYLGGDFFFPREKPDCIIYSDSLDDPALNVIIRHIASSAQILSSGGKVSNCLIHPSVRQAVHDKFASEIKQKIKWCRENADKFKELLRKEYDCLTPTKTVKASYDLFSQKAGELLEDNVSKVLIMNGKTDIDSSEYEDGCNFVIGGNTLGRGVTFPGLQTIYYTRTSKKPQADTMWQHSRMFGYDRDPGLMTVFIEEHLYKLFSDINATNNAIIAQVERGIEEIKIYYPEGLNPTRKNVLDSDHVVMLSGGTNYYPSNPDNKTIEDITNLLKPFDSSQPHYQVSLRLIKEILAHTVPSPDFNLKAFMSVIDTILSQQPTGQGILIKRENRDVAQGTGALLSPNDWSLGAQFGTKVVLTMYQVTGRKGWGGKQLWVPNIRLPEGIVFYDLVNSDTV